MFEFQRITNFLWLHLVHLATCSRDTFARTLRARTCKGTPERATVG